MPVTVIELGPCPITQVKTDEKDGYSAVQIGYSQQKKQRLSRAEAGHLDKAGVDPVSQLAEFRVQADNDLKAGDVLTADHFKAGEKVDVIGTTKGVASKGSSSAMVLLGDLPRTVQCSTVVGVLMVCANGPAT